MKYALVLIVGACPFFACAQIVTWTEKSLDLGSNVSHSDQDFQYTNLTANDVGVLRSGGSHTWYRTVTGATERPLAPDNWWGYLATLGTTVAATASWAETGVDIPAYEIYTFGHTWNEREISNTWTRHNNFTSDDYTRNGSGFWDGGDAYERWESAIAPGGGGGA